MGLKIRAGLAFGGLIMSYFFGLSGLSGIASHLDSTGNILVDIADGVGLVSKVLIYYIGMRNVYLCREIMYLTTL